jgi:hypothetical protein
MADILHNITIEASSEKIPGHYLLSMGGPHEVDPFSEIIAGKTVRKVNY